MNKNLARPREGHKTHTKKTAAPGKKILVSALKLKTSFQAYQLSHFDCGKMAIDKAEERRAKVEERKRKRQKLQQKKEKNKTKIKTQLEQTKLWTTTTTQKV